MSLRDAQIQVETFMLRAGQVAPSQPTVPTMDVAVLRHKLIQEELHEYWVHSVDALYAYKEDFLLEQTADAIGDMLYVVLGAAVAWGIDIEPVFEEIHRSNMTKFIDGTLREDGKFVKGPNYQPADLRSILKQQMD